MADLEPNPRISSSLQVMKEVSAQERNRLFGTEEEPRSLIVDPAETATKVLAATIAALRARGLLIAETELRPEDVDNLVATSIGYLARIGALRLRIPTRERSLAEDLSELAKRKSQPDLREKEEKGE